MCNHKDNEQEKKKEQKKENQLERDRRVDDVLEKDWDSDAIKPGGGAGE